MEQKTLNNLKKEFANNAHIQDFLASGGAVIPDLSGYVYEHKYYLTSLKAIQKFLDNKQKHIKEMKELFRDCKISYATCRFYFKGIDVPFDMQKELLKLQKEIYNDITVQMVEDNLDNFKELFKFAKTLKMPIATLIDLKKKEEELLSDVQYISQERKNIKYTKWLYGKVSTWIRRYIIIRDAMDKIEMPRILTGCYKRCSVENYKEIIVPIVAMGYLGFDASCMNYVEQTEKREGTFIPSTDVFDSARWEYKVEPLREYRIIRLNNLKKINNAIDNINQQEIAKRPRVRNLFQKLSVLEAA